MLIYLNKNIFKFFLLQLLVMLTSDIVCMTFDNRFLPLYFKPFIYQATVPSHFRIQPLFMRAEKATGIQNGSDVRNNGEKINIPDIFGNYDLLALDEALILSGRTNKSLVRPDLLLEGRIPFKRPSRIDAQGIAFYYQQAITNNIELGASFLFLNIDSRTDFCFGKRVNLQMGDSAEIFNTKAKINKLLGVTPPLYSQIAFGDFDLYLRFFLGWDYTCKCRRILGAAKLGMIAPTSTDIISKCNAIDNPAAIPLGGYGSWGIYGALEADVELKQDITASFYFRAIKRFKKDSLFRMPTQANEPLNYGALTGIFTRDPGWTFVLNPIVTFYGLKDGLGARVMYTGVRHLADDYSLCKLFNNKPQNFANNQNGHNSNLDRNNEMNTTINMQRVRELSKWGMEHISLGLFYDFSYYWVCPKVRPILSLYWDYPINGLFSRSSAKTNVVSLAFEMSF